MKHLLLTILIFFTFDAFSQRNVSGVVFDDFGEPIMGAVVMETGTQHGVMADFDGKFHLTTLCDIASLTISFIGMFPKTVKITQDTVLNITLNNDNRPLISIDCRYSGVLRIGTNYDIVNSVFGLSLSNGYETRPIRDCFFDGILLYKINAQTNFDNDYSFGVNLALPNIEPPHIFGQWLFITPSIGYKQYSFSSQNFFHRDIYVSTATLIQRWNMELTLKLGYQTLNNDFNNFGGTFGFQREFWCSRKIFGQYGASIGYYFDYLTYSAYLQGHIARGVFYRLTYNKIDNHDFFNIGLSYIFNRRMH